MSMSKETSILNRTNFVSCMQILAAINKSSCENGHIDVNENNSEMEHSYSRDWRPSDGAQSSTTRTLMVHRPPQCPSCHIHSHDEGIDLDEPYNPPIPSYNEENAKLAMQECDNLTRNLKNSNPEDLDWEEKINKFGWTIQQIKLFSKVARLLDADRLARLTHEGKQHEPVHRRVVIDKSVERLRQALASVSWEARLTQWIHGLLLENLPPSFLSAYIDILQTLKSKVPSLVDKMVFGRPGLVNQDVLGPVLKKPWEPVVAHKNRKLPGQPFIVVVPSGPNLTTPSTRVQKWYSLFATMASVVPVQMPVGGSLLQKQNVHNVAEQMVAITRAKIQDIRNEAPNRPIILVGFNAGASLAIQIGLVESVSCIVCIGFAYNTVSGVRGAPDDRILDITAPVLFVIGQNSARSSQEEMEFLRERMVAQTSLVVVGSADDCLRVSKNKRKIEGVTQSMVDNMVMDEISEFATTCLLNPQKPKQTIKDPNGQKTGILLSPNSRKRKVSQSSDSDNVKLPKTPKGPKPKKTPVKGMKNNLLAQPTTEVLNMAVQSILPDSEVIEDVKVKKEVPTIITSYQISSENAQKMEIRQTSGSQVVSGLASSPIVLPMLNRDSSSSATQNIKVISGNQFIQLKPSTIPQQKSFTIKTSPTITKQIVNIPKGQTLTTIPPVKSMILKTKPTQNSFSPTKFTIMRGNGSSSFTEKVDKTQTPDLSSTNIFDIPIVFADNEGNIQDSPPKEIAKKDPALMNKFVTIPKKQSNFVVINKNAMKQCPPNMINTKNIPALKFQKVVLKDPASVSKNLNQILSGQSTTTTTMVKTGTTQTSTSNTIITQQKFHPIVINVDSDKTTVKNIIRVGDTQIKPSLSNVTATTMAPNTIVIKTSGASSTQANKAKPTILNRNLTVRKIVNLTPQQQQQHDD